MDDALARHERYAHIGKLFCDFVEERAAATALGRSRGAAAPAAINETPAESFRRALAILGLASVEPERIPEIPLMGKTRKRILNVGVAAKMLGVSLGNADVRVLAKQARAIYLRENPDLPAEWGTAECPPRFKRAFFPTLRRLILAYAEEHGLPSCD